MCGALPGAADAHATGKAKSTMSKSEAAARSVSHAVRYAWAGVALGVLTPVLASFAAAIDAGGPISLGGLLAQHCHNPLFWIIDTGPLVLGTIAWWAGRQRDKLLLLRRQLQQIVDTRTAELTRSEALYRTLTESAPVAIVIHRMDEILFLNPVAAHMVGTTGPDRPSWRLSDFLHPDDHRLALQRLRLMHGEGQLPPVGVYRAVMPDGSIEHIEASTAPVQFNGGEAALTIAKNITMRINAERGMDRMRQEAELSAARMEAIATELETKNAELDAALTAAYAATKAKGDFLATISHEIRTPLNGILGMLHLLTDTELNAEQRDFARTIKQSAEALLRIINNILDFSKIEAGRMELDSVEFNLQIVVKGVTDLLTPKAVEKGLELGITIEGDVPLLLRGDPGRLRQVLINLVGNAIKFTETGEVLVAVGLIEDTGETAILRFEVRDTGIGIRADRYEALFEPFSQLDSSTTRKYEGTGLGLAISRQLVQLLGGELSVTSTPGQGSVFSFTVRLGRPDAPDDQPPTDAQTTVGLRVLVVDDNPVNQKVAINLLRKAGHTVDLAVNGQEAVELANRRDYELILMDCHMPEMDGFQATAAIRAAEGPRGPVPIIAMTANVTERDREACLAVGMNDYIAKPVEPQELLAVVRKHSPAHFTMPAAAPSGEPPASQPPPSEHQLAGDWQPTPMDIEASIARAGDREFWQELVETFVAETSSRLEALEQALAAGQAEAVTREAHTIKGSAAEMLAEPVRQLALELEKLGATGNLSAGPTVLSRLRREYDRLLVHLAEHDVRTGD